MLEAWRLGLCPPTVSLRVFKLSSPPDERARDSQGEYWNYKVTLNLSRSLTTLSIARIHAEALLKNTFKLGHFSGGYYR